MDVGEEKHMCVAGSLSAKPGKVAEEGRSGWRWCWRWILGPKEARRGHIIIWNDYLANEPWGAGKLTAKQIKPAPDILMFFINKWWCQCVCVCVCMCFLVPADLFRTNPTQIFRIRLTQYWYPAWGCVSAFRYRLSLFFGRSWNMTFLWNAHPFESCSRRKKPDATWPKL